MKKNRCPAATILLGLILIVVGALVLLANLDILPFDVDLAHWWPLILVVLGVVHLWNNRNIFDFSGLFLILLGVVFLMATLGKIFWERRLALLAGGADPARPLHRFQEKSRCARPGSGPGPPAATRTCA